MLWASQSFLFIWDQSNIYDWSHVANVAACNSPWQKGSWTCFILCCFQGIGRRVCLCTTQSVGRALGTWSEGHPYTPLYSIACLALVCSYGTPVQRTLVVTEAHTWGAQRVGERWRKERACCRLSARQPFCTEAHAACRSPDCCLSRHVPRRKWDLRKMMPLVVYILWQMSCNSLSVQC